MGRRRWIQVGDRSFGTLAEALAHIRAIRDCYVPGAAVTDPDHEEFLFDLLNMHPDVVQKTGAGIDHFDVRNNGGTTGFGLVRVDGSDDNFSFITCLGPPTHAQYVRAAMREGVRDQRDAFREAQFAGNEVHCGITGEVLTRENSDVHHDRNEFLNLAEAFAESVGGYGLIGVTSGDGVIGRRLADASLARQWAEFHRERASLVLVSRSANRGLLRRGRKRA